MLFQGKIMAQESISVNSMFKKPEENKATPFFSQTKPKIPLKVTKLDSFFESKLLPTDLEVVVHVLHVITQWL